MAKRASYATEQGKLAAQVRIQSAEQTNQLTATQDPIAAQQGLFATNKPLQLQRLVGNQATNRIIQRSGVIQRKEWYAYGSADEVPHIHCYSGGDCHLKIQDRGSVKRYNLVQKGKKYKGSVDDALAAAAGNQALIDAINTCIEGY